MSESLLSHPEFGKHTNGSDVADAFSASIRGKNVCITGVSPKSLGERLAINIAKHAPATLILASRTPSKLEAVAETIKSETPEVSPKLVTLDLASLEAVHTAAAEISNIVDSIHILINNGAVTSSARKVTVDGIERTFGTNHIGHFLFTSLLTPQLVAGQARVVNVSSAGYRLSPIRFHDYNFEGKDVPPEEQSPTKLPSHLTITKERRYGPFPAYAQSKTANILHCVGLNKRLGSKGVKAFAVHPGTIWTDLSRDLAPDDLKFIETSTDWISQDQGTSTILVAALDPKLAGVDDISEVYLSECHLSSVEGFANNADIAEQLWQLSEKLAGESPRL